MTENEAIKEAQKLTDEDGWIRFVFRRTSGGFGIALERPDWPIVAVTR